MLCDTLIIYDHLFQTIKVVSHVFAPALSAAVAPPTPAAADGSKAPPLPTGDLAFIYATAVSKARRIAKLLLSNATPSVTQSPIPPPDARQAPVSNVGKAGYERFVTTLKQHIVKGDIIQAVPSQRLSKPTALHPFNAYRHLRQVNPSPYMFYLDCGDLQLVGASPETLCKVEKNKVYNHAIAGTVRRGKTAEGVQRVGAIL
jgi:anthranilate synthase component 1